MDSTELKEKLEGQLEGTEKQIRNLEESLAKAKEYLIKLQGGLETLELIDSDNKEEINNTET